MTDNDNPRLDEILSSLHGKITEQHAKDLYDAILAKQEEAVEKALEDDRSRRFYNKLEIEEAVLAARIDELDAARLQDWTTLSKYIKERLAALNSKKDGK